MSSSHDSGRGPEGHAQADQERPGDEERQEIFRKRSFFLWWVLACAIGGVVASYSILFEMLFFVPVFGGVLGVAQWLVLQSYLRRAGLWVLASFFGWLAGAMVRMILLVGAFPGAATTDPGTSILGLDPYFVYEPVVWAIFGLAQGLVLLLILRSRSLGLVLLWVLATSLGGIFHAAIRYLLLFTLALQGTGGEEGSVGAILGETWFLSEGFGLALYGIPTGLVLAQVVGRAYAARPEIRSTVTAETPAPTRAPSPPLGRRGLMLALAIVVWMFVLFIGAWWSIRELTGIGCSSGERAAINEFPHYGDSQAEPYSGEVSCNAKYVTDATRDEVLGYYEDRLLENDWEILGVWAADPPKGIEFFGERLSDVSEAPEEVRAGLGARQGDYRYGVTYHPPEEGMAVEADVPESELSGDEAFVLVEVTDEPEPPGGKGSFPK